MYYSLDPHSVGTLWHPEPRSPAQATPVLSGRSGAPIPFRPTAGPLPRSQKEASHHRLAISVLSPQRTSSQTLLPRRLGLPGNAEREARCRASNRRQFEQGILRLDSELSEQRTIAADCRASHRLGRERLISTSPETDPDRR